MNVPAVQADFYSMLSQHGKRLCCSLYVAAFPRTHARTHARTSSQLERGAASSPASTEGSGLSYAQRFSKTHCEGRSLLSILLSRLPTTTTQRGFGLEGFTKAKPCPVKPDFWCVGLPGWVALMAIRHMCHASARASRFDRSTKRHGALTQQQQPKRPVESFESGWAAVAGHMQKSWLAELGREGKGRGREFVSVVDLASLSSGLLAGCSYDQRARLPSGPPAHLLDSRLASSSDNRDQVWFRSKGL